MLSLSALAFSFGVSLRILPCLNLKERLASSPPLAAALIIGAANTLGPVACRWPLTLAFAALAILLFLPLGFWPKHREVNSPFGFWWGKILFLGCVLFYVSFAQFRYLDTDNWIHEPLIGGYTLGVFPPVHPFFPEAAMNGHYGRDLLIGTLTPHGVDSLWIVWVINPLFALSGALLLLSIFEREEHGKWPSLLAAVFPYFGMCVGFRVGLVDTTDGNNGLVYAMVIFLIYLCLKVLEFDPEPSEKAQPGLWLCAGFVLGIYQLVYETHFGLLLLMAASLLPWAIARSRNKGRLLAGVFITAGLSLVLAATEGGPITDLVHSKALGKAAISGTADDKVSDLNVEQHVSLKFPKEELFKVRATAAEYQRLSVGFRMEPFRNWVPNISGVGYLSIFSPKFLVTHWLPLFLCPWTLIWLVKRKSAAGLAFWSFGTWAYFVPGLIDFGPVYEWEYFRWEFAAGFGWAAACGLFIGSLLELKDTKPPLHRDQSGQWNLHLHAGHKAWIGGVLLAVLGLLPGEKLLNRALIDMQKNGLPGPTSPASFRLAQKDLGLARADLLIAQELAAVIESEQRVLTNLGSETPFGLWPDSVLSGLTGARISGRARPPVDRRVHAHPNYHRSMIWKAVVASGNISPLLATDIEWLVIDPSQGPWTEILSDSPFAKLEKEVRHQDQTRQLWRLLRDALPLALNASPPSLPPGTQIEARKLDDSNKEIREWRTASSYALHLQTPTPAPRTWVKLSVVDKKKRSSYPPILFLIDENNSNILTFTTPLEEGNFELLCEQLRGEESVEIARLPLPLNFRSRLQKLDAAIEVPGARPPKGEVDLKVKLSSAPALFSQDELLLLLRFRRDGGDYVWELDRLPKDLNLNLAEGGTATIEWKVVAPWEPGAYILELEILDRKTGLRTILQQQSSAKLLVVAP